MDCTICVAKTKTLINFAVTAKLICVFVFAYAKSRFSHKAAHIIELNTLLTPFNRNLGFALSHTQNCPFDNVKMPTFSILSDVKLLQKL